MEKNIFMALGLCVALLCTGCGRRGDPLPVPGTEKSYPLTYPAPDEEEPEETPCP
ncbi:MAG: hypothetical protein LCH26_01190 [Proteobacteria bacterium]|nr:hypothetical protein [Pseudomonadota bacterium]